MNKELTIPVQDQNWFKLLIEECQAIITESVFSSRWALIEGYHQLGKRILDEYANFERAKIYGEKIVQYIAQSLGRSERTIYYAIEFVKKYPNLDSLPEGKNISWTKVTQKYLVTNPQSTIETNSPSGVIELICPRCGARFTLDEATKVKNY